MVRRGGTSRDRTNVHALRLQLWTELAASKRESLARAHDAGVVCSDEFLLHPDPYTSRERWCHERLRFTERRLASMAVEGMQAVFVNHLSLARQTHSSALTSRVCSVVRHGRDSRLAYALRRQGGCLWDLHIPCSSIHDGVRFEEASLGYPRQRRRWPRRPVVPRRIFAGESAA